MKAFRHTDSVEVRKVKGKKQRGVFARQDILKGTLIERVPVILIPRNQVYGDAAGPLKDSRLTWYVYEWDPIRGREYVALALGYGSMYNHSYKPNAEYVYETPDILEFVAIKKIKKDDEITINYNGDIHDKSPVGFTVED